MRGFTWMAACAVVAMVAIAGAANGQVVRSLPGQPEARTALDLYPAKTRLTVTSPAFKDGGDIPYENTQYRGNIFPGLAWTAGPPGTRSYVLIMQDSSLLFRGTPILHWTMYNIPAGVTRLEPGMTAPPTGASYGPNYKGPSQPYTGPRTPPGPKDAYHFEIFALDTTLPAVVADYPALTAALSGHILASGEVVGLGQKDPTAP
jgi:para-nitrobenzyl esterase